MLEEKIKLLNYVVNQPEVLRGVAPGMLSVDMSGFFNSPDALIFGDEHGVVIFSYVGDGIYEGHYLLTDTLSRKRAMARFRGAIRALFTDHNASVINGVTPRDNKAARFVNRALGFHPVGTATDTMGRPCIKYRLERETWVRQSAALSEA